MPGDDAGADAEAGARADAGVERGVGPAPAVRRLASWLRARGRVERPAAGPDAVAPPTAPAADRTAEPPSPTSRLRPQPEDDASVYPLF